MFLIVIVCDGRAREAPLDHAELTALTTYHSGAPRNQKEVCCGALRLLLSGWDRDGEPRARAAVQVSLEIPSLAPGTYLVIPCTYDAGYETDFNIRLYVLRGPGSAGGAHVSTFCRYTRVADSSQLYMHAINSRKLRSSSLIPVVEPAAGGQVAVRAQTLACRSSWLAVAVRYIYKRGASSGSGWRRRCVAMGFSACDVSSVRVYDRRWLVIASPPPRFIYSKTEEDLTSVQVRFWIARVCGCAKC